MAEFADRTYYKYREVSPGCYLSHKNFLAFLFRWGSNGYRVHANLSFSDCRGASENILEYWSVLRRTEGPSRSMGTSASRVHSRNVGHVPACLPYPLLVPYSPGRMPQGNLVPLCQRDARTTFDQARHQPVSPRVDSGKLTC